MRILTYSKPTTHAELKKNGLNGQSKNVMCKIHKTVRNKVETKDVPFSYFLQNRISNSNESNCAT